MNADPSPGQVIAFAFQLMREDGYDTTKDQPLSLVGLYLRKAETYLTQGLPDLE